MFNQQKIKGKVAEEVVKRHLTGRGHKINDVSENPEYWKYDIDLIITNWKTPITIEVKRDDNLFTTGNIFVEVGFEKEGYYSTGWFNMCKADYIAFFDCKTKKGIICDLDKLKETAVQKGQKKLFWDKVDQCWGTALLLNIAKAKKFGVIVYQWEELEWQDV